MSPLIGPIENPAALFRELLAQGRRKTDDCQLSGAAVHAEECAAGNRLSEALPAVERDEFSLGRLDGETPGHSITPCRLTPLTSGSTGPRPTRCSVRNSFQQSPGPHVLPRPGLPAKRRRPEGVPGFTAAGRRTLPTCSAFCPLSPGLSGRGFLFGLPRSGVAAEHV